jgi:hypothetical protein
MAACMSATAYAQPIHRSAAQQARLQSRMITHADQRIGSQREQQAAPAAITKNTAGNLKRYLMVQIDPRPQITFTAATPFSLSLEAISCGCRADGAHRASCPRMKRACAVRFF